MNLVSLSISSICWCACSSVCCANKSRTSAASFPLNCVASLPGKETAGSRKGGSRRTCWYHKCKYQRTQRVDKGVLSGELTMLLAVSHMRCCNTGTPEELAPGPKRTCQNLNPEKLPTCSETELRESHRRARQPHPREFCQG